MVRCLPRVNCVSVNVGKVTLKDGRGLNLSVDGNELIGYRSFEDLRDM